MVDRITAAHRQLRKLYTNNFLANISLASAAWVALLVMRGFTLVEVGIAETVFHITSIIAEIPSGMFADVFGRKKCLMVGTLCSIISSVALGFTSTFAGVVVSMVFCALSYNFGSGTDSALAYDTLKETGHSEEYDRYISIQTVIYRIATSLASLGAGLALTMGNRNAQILGICISLIQLAVVLTLRENNVILAKKTLSYRTRLTNLIRESVAFLKGNHRATRLIFGNTLVSAVDVLLLFFLQARFQSAGAGNIMLGILLFITYSGGILGAFVASRYKDKAKFEKLFFVCFTIVTAGACAAFTNVLWIMTLGGFFAAFGDDLLQIRADVTLNGMIPEASRATLISVNSLCFSLIMIVLSPLAGMVFS